MSSPKYVIEVPHRVGEVKLHEFSQPYIDSVIGMSCKIGGVPGLDRANSAEAVDRALLAYAGSDLHALYEFESDEDLSSFAEAITIGMLKVHRGIEVAHEIARFLALYKPRGFVRRAPDFVARFAPEAGLAAVDELMSEIEELSRAWFGCERPQVLENVERHLADAREQIQLGLSDVLQHFA